MRPGDIGDKPVFGGTARYTNYVQYHRNEMPIACVLDSHHDSKIHGANTGPIWGRQDRTGGPQYGHTISWNGQLVLHHDLRVNSQCIIHLQLQLLPQVRPGDNGDKPVFGGTDRYTNYVQYQRNEMPIACVLESHHDSKVHGANMGHIWGRQDRTGGPHFGPINFVIRANDYYPGLF